MNHLPVASGLVLCELVIVDHETRNVAPVNCFRARKLKSPPATIEFTVVAWLSDGFGKLNAEINVERLDTLEDVFHVESVLEFDHRLNDKYFLARIRNCAIPSPGQYVVSLLIGGELIADRKFRIYT